jgi:cobalt-zinc-cadmium efflux system outer membrane protein
MALLPRRIKRSISFAQFTVLMLSLIFMGFAQAKSLTLTEREAVSSALSRPAWVDAETGRVAQAESIVTEASMLPNPVFSSSRDRLGMIGGDITERSTEVSQTFDLSGRRMLRRGAATSRLDAERLDGQVRRLNAIAEVRRTFSETIHHNQIQIVMALWLSRTEHALIVTARLAKAGEVSGYDRRRLEREVQTAKARLAVAQTDATRSREILAALTGKNPDEVINLLGDLTPEAVPTIDVFQTGLRHRADLASLLAQSEAFDREQQAAQRGWIPDVTLGIGQKTLDEPTRSGGGAIVSVSFAIPLFDRGVAAQQRNLAKAQTARAEYALAVSKAEAELRGVWNQAEELRKAVETYRSNAADESHNLSTIAEAAYHAGEAGLLELLDAYRTELDSATNELDLALRARLARINLEVLSGVSFYE